LALSGYSERCDELSDGGGEGRSESMVYDMPAALLILLFCGKMMLLMFV